MRLLVAIAATVAVVMGAVVTQPWLASTDLVRDSQVVAAAHGDTSPAYGLVSNLGIVITVLAAGAAITAIGVGSDGPDDRRLLAWVAGLSIIVAMDDLLLLHEAAAFGPGSGAALATSYAAGFVMFAMRFRDLILDRLDPILLALMFAGLGTSAAVDALIEPATPASVLVEDGAKLLGLLAWSAFVVRAAVLAIRATDSGPARP